VKAEAVEAEASAGEGVDCNEAMYWRTVSGG
jgi:hypothetical protein